MQPRRLIHAARHSFQITGPVPVVAAGKAACGLLDAFAEHARVSAHVLAADGGHPLPDARSVEHGEAALALRDRAREAGQPLVVLLSGGASAMLEALPDGTPLDLVRDVTRRLLDAGCGIHDLNTVRRHLSRIKGGRLAAGTPCLTFALSDVLDDDPPSIGSGPTVGDPTTMEDAVRVLERFGIARDVPGAVDAVRRAGETPKPGDVSLAGSLFHVIGSRRTAMDAVVNAAIEREVATIVFDEAITGEAAGAGEAFALRALAAARRISGPIIVVATGETTVMVRGNGRGGRNQEFALGAAAALDGTPASLLAVGTDGIDGNSPAAGAIVDGTTLERAREAGIDAEDMRKRSDTFALFDALGDAVVTGPTGTNVSDLAMLYLP